MEEEYNKLKSITPDEKKANRMKITARLKTAAKNDRLQKKKKEGESEAGDGDSLFV
jgi:hypothetical protein